jgi:hypothetical protein
VRRQPNDVGNPRLCATWRGESLYNPHFEGVCRAVSQATFELNALSIRAEEISLAADTLVSQSQPHCVYWAETGGLDESRFQRVTLACAPIEIAPVLRERLFAQEHSVVLTSATLATRSIKSHEATGAVSDDDFFSLGGVADDGGAEGRLAGWQDVLPLGRPGGGIESENAVFLCAGFASGPSPDCYPI